MKLGMNYEIWKRTLPRTEWEYYSTDPIKTEQEAKDLAARLNNEPWSKKNGWEFCAASTEIKIL